MVSTRLPMADNGGGTAVRMPRQRNARRHLPEWFRTTLPSGNQQTIFNTTKDAISGHTLNTVCQEAKCPNIHECWSAGDATFMIAGQECTRGCKFCAVGTIKRPPPLDPAEPENLATAIELMNLNHAVITVVNRDDLADNGVAHYRLCLEKVHEICPEISLEFLCSDLAGDLDDLRILLDGLNLDVFAHNVECVPRLDTTVRDHRASFEQSIKILRETKRLRPDIFVKSSLMVGVGETDEEVVETLKLLRAAGVDFVTIGQYLAPSTNHLPIDRFPQPEKFSIWQKETEKLGFLGSACGPMVRSSYRAGEMLKKARINLAEQDSIMLRKEEGKVKI